MKLEGKRIILRQPKKSDTKYLIKNMDKEVARHTVYIRLPYALKDAKKHIRNCWNKNRKKEALELHIELKENKEMIGGAGITYISKNHKAGEIGYWLAKKYWKKGYAKEACLLLLDYGFNKLKLEKMYAKTAKPNKASWGLMKSLGMKHEATTRKHRIDRISKKRVDEVTYGILKKEYEKKYTKNKLSRPRKK